MVRLAAACGLGLIAFAVGCGFSLGSADLAEPTLTAAPPPPADAAAGSSDEPPGTDSAPLDGGSAPASDAAPDAAPPTSGPLRAFVTSAIVNGNLGGVEGADALCARLADAAKLPGKYQAWISAGGTNAIDRLKGEGPWRRVDGVEVAASRADLGSGVLAKKLNRDEKGAIPPESEDRVWTGTTTAGKASGTDCGGWASTDGRGLVGEAEETNGGWTSLESEPCTEVNRLYCLQQ
jgi:hypothetical protein